MIRTQPREWKTEGHVNGPWDDCPSSDDFEAGGLSVHALSAGWSVHFPSGLFLAGLMFQFRKVQVAGSALDMPQGIREAPGSPEGGLWGKQLL